MRNVTENRSFERRITRCKDIHKHVDTCNESLTQLHIDNKELPGIEEEFKT